MKSIVLVCVVVMNASYAFGVKPSKPYIATPEQVGLQYDSLNIMTSDGVRLTAWLCKPDGQATGTVIIAGGDAGNMSYQLNLAGLLVSALKVRVLLFDYRGFGSSSAFSTDTNVLVYPEYLIDVRAVVEWSLASVDTTQNQPAKVICFGRSMGAALAISLANDDRLSGVVAESPYKSQHITTKRSNERERQRKSKRVVRFIDHPSLEPVSSIRHVRTRVALIGGETDKMVLTRELMDLFNLAPREIQKWLVVEGNAGHLEIADKAPYTVVGLVSSLMR